MECQKGPQPTPSVYSSLGVGSTLGGEMDLSEECGGVQMGELGALGKFDVGKCNKGGS